MTLVSADVYGGTVLDIAPGSTLGRYELLIPIAVGGMARVWAARLRGHAGFTKLVAVKMILPELAEDASFQQMFTDEARIASLVRHPNVCETYDLAETRGILYLAMEWVDGASLLKVMRHSRDYSDTGAPRTPLDPRLSARIIADACAGLHAAHELLGDDGAPLHVIHRDATPHNILIAADGRVKVSDFGVAKALGQSHATLVGEVKGKVAYMAPEQLTGDPMDRRVDVFALGVSLYEATTGRKPFIGDSDPQVMAKIMLGKFDKPSLVRPGFPVELEKIILRAMDLSPPKRFETAEKMQLALEQYISRSGPPVLASAVAELVKLRCGAEIDARRETIRLAQVTPPARDAQFPSEADVDVHVTVTTEHDTNPAPPPVPETENAGKSDASIQMNGAVDLRSSRSREAPRWGLIAGAAACAAFIAIAAGGFAFVRMHRSNGDASSAIGLVENHTSTTPLGTIDLVPASHPASSATATTSALKQVHMQVSPPGAVLIVDGVVMPRGTNVVMLRPDGEAESVLIRAEKYEDYVVILDSETPSEIEVTLTPAGATAAPLVRHRARPVSSAASAPSAGASSAKPANGDALPNPYGE